MTGNEYQQLALRTANPGLSLEDQLLNGLMGMSGEAGEALDLLKKALFQGHELDRMHLAKEIGDVMWYVSLACHAIGFELDEVLEMNIEKLKRRYPITFDTDLSQHRKAGDV